MNHENKKPVAKKLVLSKETVRELAGESKRQDKAETRIFSPCIRCLTTI